MTTSLPIIRVQGHESRLTCSNSNVVRFLPPLSAQFASCTWPSQLVPMSTRRLSSLPTGDHVVVSLERSLFRCVLCTLHYLSTTLKLSPVNHRGSPCHFPEETLEGFSRAIEYGVDYIEMDVVRNCCPSDLHKQNALLSFDLIVASTT